MVHVITSLTRPVAPVRIATPPPHTGSTHNSSSSASTSSAATSPASTSPASTASATTSSASTGDAAADFRALFSGTYPATTGPSTADTPPNPTPTAESVFGPNPWVTNPTGIGPNGPYSLNPYYFATPQTAATVAQMVGGTVIQANSFTPNGGPFQQQQPNLMVQLPNGSCINPGLVASFYTHGYPQSYINMMIASEVQNA